MRQISDWPVASGIARILPGKRGAKATWPGCSAVKSVMNRVPPDIARLRPANRPPPVWVSMTMPSVIQAMAAVWL